MRRMATAERRADLFVKRQGLMAAWGHNMQ